MEVRHAIIVRGEILNSNNIFKSEVTLKDIVLPVYWVMVYGRLIKNVVCSLIEVSDRRFWEKEDLDMYVLSPVTNSRCPTGNARFWQRRFLCIFIQKRMSMSDTWLYFLRAVYMYILSLLVCYRQRRHTCWTCAYFHELRFSLDPNRWRWSSGDLDIYIISPIRDSERLKIALIIRWPRGADTFICGSYTVLFSASNLYH